MIGFSLVLASLLLLTRASAEEISCDLQCSNGGYCTLVDGTVDELARKVQSGQLIEKCVCQPGFTGTACDDEVEECTLPERKCHNGSPCVQNSDGEWGCDCSLADSMGPFASHQCRKRTTDYCSGKYDPTAALSFCTHGGRCKADFLSYSVATGETSDNQAYQHRGCVCPPEFTGPHCEFLLHPDVVLEDVQSEIIDNGPVSETKRSFHIAATTMLGLALVLVVAVIFKKIRSRRPIPKEITVKSNPWVSQSRHYGGYRDSIYNGRHISSQSVNLRAGSRFGDESDFVDVQIT